MKCQLLATTLAALALPATAAASTGLVVSVNPAQHSIQLAGPNHTVEAYYYSGKLPKRVHRGSWISYKQSASHVRHVHSHHGAHSVSFQATVVRTTKGTVVLRLSDGKLVTFSASQLRGHRHHRRHGPIAFAAAGDVTLNIQGLQPGESVLVTETVDGNGNLTITITQSSQNGNGGNPVTPGQDQDVTGTVTQISDDGLTISTPSGPMTFVTDTSDLTDGYLVGDVVDVTYTQESNGLLDANDVEYVEGDVTGTVRSVTDSSLTLVEDGTGQVVTFVADPSDGVFDGILAGQAVDVTYHQGATGLVADNVDNGSD